MFKTSFMNVQSRSDATPIADGVPCEFPRGKQLFEGLKNHLKNITVSSQTSIQTSHCSIDKNLEVKDGVLDRSAKRETCFVDSSKTLHIYGSKLDRSVDRETCFGTTNKTLHVDENGSSRSVTRDTVFGSSKKTVTTDENGIKCNVEREICGISINRSFEIKKSKCEE